METRLLAILIALEVGGQEDVRSLIDDAIGIADFIDGPEVFTFSNQAASVPPGPFSEPEQFEKVQESIKKAKQGIFDRGPGC